MCDSWIESVSHHKNSIWGCSVTAGFVGLEKGIHSLWNPAGLIHEITKITLPPHPHVYKCLLLVSQHHICSVVTLDDAGCNSVGHPRLQSCANAALGSSWHKTMVPLWFSVCAALPLLSALLLESKQLARIRAAHLRVMCFHRRALRDSPFLLWMWQPQEHASQRAMLSRDMNAWSV